MRKKFLTLATVATLAVIMAACGTAQTSNNPTLTVEPTKEVEATTAPTATTTPTVEPTTEPTVEPTATSTPTPEPTSTPTPEPTLTEAPVAEDDGTLWAVVEELLPLEASERAAYLESKYGTRYVITVENNLDKLLPESLTAEQKELAHESFLGAMDWCFGPNMSGARPTGEYYLTLLTDTVTGQAHTLWFSIYQNLYDAYGFEVTSTILKECNPRDFYEIFYYNVEEYGLEFDINGDGVLGYNEELYVSKTEELTETPAEPTVDVAEDPNFALLKDIAFTMEYMKVEPYTYDEIASIIEELDKSRYVVTAVEGLSPVLKETLTDAQKQSVLDALIAGFTDPSACNRPDFWGYGKVQIGNSWVSCSATPTGEFYTMTLTDTVTDETFAWGVRVTVEVNDKPGTYYVHEDVIFDILYEAQASWLRGDTDYTNCAKDYTDVFDEKYYIYGR